MSSIWDNCLTKLENEIASSDFSTWIRPLQAIESDGQLKLLAPNRFVLDWVKQYYFAKIEESIHEFSNGTLDLNLEIGSKKTTALATVSAV
ncbi:MAG: DnaA N-terminal domain-containing protein, partial [Methylococcaceae bacterium]